MTAATPAEPRARRGRRGLVLAALAGAVVTGALVAALALPLALTHRDDLPFERAYADAVVSLVSRLGAGDATSPLTDQAAAVSLGRASYTGMCSICHGALGDGRGVFGRATYPDAADLTSARTVAKTDAQLFWITKNGLSFTAMPAFRDVYADTEIWALVAYIRALQRGRAEPIPVPQPTSDDLAQADPRGGNVARGAAIFYAQGCYRCHGPEADAPGELAIRGRIGREIVPTLPAGVPAVRGRVGKEVVRKPPPGMPTFGPDRISDAELADLEAFLLSLGADPRTEPVQAAAGR